MAKTFEELLYVGSVVFLASSKADARKRKSDPEQSTALKKSKLNCTKSVESEISAVATSSLAGVLGLKALSDHTGQRIGPAIKKFVEGLNVLAKNLGFEGIEQLVLLYARPSRLFGVIPNRSYGFVLKSQTKDFQESSSLTTEEEETIPNITERSDEVDCSIRIFAMDFFKDVSNAKISSHSYPKPEFQFRPYLQSFEQPGLSLPERFGPYSRTITDVICSFLQTEPEKEPHLLSVLPPEQNSEVKEDEDVILPVETSDERDEANIKNSDRFVSKVALGNVQCSDTIDVEDKNVRHYSRMHGKDSFLVRLPASRPSGHKFVYRGNVDRRNGAIGDYRSTLQCSTENISQTPSMMS